MLAEVNWSRLDSNQHGVYLTVLPLDDVTVLARLGGRPTAADLSLLGRIPADLYRRHPGSLIGNLPTPHTYPTNLCGFHQTVYASSANAVCDHGYRSNLASRTPYRTYDCIGGSRC